MGSGFAPRFAVEVAFLGLLALACGLAELETPWIVAVMTVGWLLVALIEWLAWRGEADEPLGPAATGGEPELDEPTDSWNIEEILAPLPEAPVDGPASGDAPARRTDDETP